MRPSLAERARAALPAAVDDLSLTRERPGAPAG